MPFLIFYLDFESGNPDMATNQLFEVLSVAFLTDYFQNTSKYELRNTSNFNVLKRGQFTYFEKSKSVMQNVLIT